MDSTFINLESLIRDAGLLTEAKRRKKFMLVGTHAHQTTGYSKVTYHIIQELAKRDICDIYHFGFQKFIGDVPGYREYPKGVDVYDPAAKERLQEAEPEMGFGFSQLPDYVRSVKPDILMIYNDAGVICKFLEKLAEKNVEKTYKTIIYLDQVYSIQRPDILARIDKDADIYFAFTQYWKEMLAKQGIHKPIHILRHGFDREQFVQLDKRSMRQKHKIPENAFLILNLNRNTPRKRHDISTIAFAEFVSKHPDLPLIMLCICDAGETGGFPLQEIFLRELVRFNLNPNDHLHKFMLSKSSMTFPDTVINELYALSDIGVNTAEGEGFGLCQFESMGIGVPQVVSDVGGFKDFCKHNINSLVVPIYWRAYLALGQSSVGGIAEYVKPSDVCSAFERYLLDPDLRLEHGKNAMLTVLEYTWQKEVESLANIIRDL